jgi:hypothetical protein
MVAEKSCFVIGVIGLPGSKERKHADLVLNYIIKAAINPTEYDVRRGDDGDHTGMITTSIIRSLLEAHLVVADLTFLNPNVFYELGVRHAARLPAIHLISYDTVIPFDTADHRAILYDINDYNSHQEAIKTVQAQIKRIHFGFTNPVTLTESVANDERLRLILDSLDPSLKALESRLDTMVEPLKGGRVTREEFTTSNKGHRSAILDIVTNIRQKIDQRATSPFNQPLQNVSSMLQRLEAIERIVQEGAASRQIPIDVEATVTEH